MQQAVTKDLWLIRGRTTGHALASALFAAYQPHGIGGKGRDWPSVGAIAGLKEGRKTNCRSHSKPGYAA